MKVTFIKTTLGILPLINCNVWEEGKKVEPLKIAIETLDSMNAINYKPGKSLTTINDTQPQMIYYT